MRIISLNLLGTPTFTIFLSTKLLYNDKARFYTGSKWDFAEGDYIREQD